MTPSTGVTVGLKLLYERGGEKIAFSIEEGETFIGRKDYCDICFPEQSVSKRHVKVVKHGAKIELFDAGSRNGTLVNGKDVPQTGVPLRDGDVIQLGKITLTVSGGDASGFSQESRARKSRDSFRDFDDFDEGTDDQDAVAEEEAAAEPPPPASTKKVELRPEKKKSERGAVEAKPDPALRSDSFVETDLVGSNEIPPKTRLVIVAGDGKGSVHELTGEKAITLGTKEENDIPLKGDGISRYHAQILLENGAWVLKDLGSRNGTFVGDRKVDDHELAPGDVVMIGTVYLRFEQESWQGPKGSAGAQVKALIELLKRDPKGFVKSQNGRRAIMIVLALLIAAVLLAPSPEAGVPGPGGGDSHAASEETTALPHQVIELLQKDQSQKARELIARTRGSFKLGQDRPFLQDLDDLAKVWVDHGAPLTFEWRGAIAAIEKCLHNGTGELDKDCIEWLDKQKAEIEAEEPNSKAILKGGSDLSAAQNASRRGDVKEAIAKYRSAVATYQKIPKKSILYGPAQSKSETARSSLFKLLQKEAERLVSLDPPPWQDAIDRLNEAIEYASSLEEKTPLRNKIDECQANQRDEESFARAVDIVQQRNTARYDDAIDLLASISKTSRVYPDAQTYLHWIQADRDVRNAKISYDEGNWDKARSLLENALKVVELGPDAKASVNRRYELWSTVQASLTEGLTLSAKGDDAGATAKLENVLKLEPNPKNRYHVLAEGELNNIRDRGDKWIDQKLQEGLESLEKAHYKDAHERFKYVIQHSKQDPSRRARIEAAVRELNQRKRLYSDCYKRWLTNENAMYDGLLDVLLVLGSYLPMEDPDRPKARDLYKKVKERLKVAMDQNKQDDDDDGAKK